jgi:hypothetical protein
MLAAKNMHQYTKNRKHFYGARGSGQPTQADHCQNKQRQLNNALPPPILFFLIMSSKNIFYNKKSARYEYNAIGANVCVRAGEHGFQNYVAGRGPR